MNTNNSQLSRKIMRRVYYAFAVRVVRHELTIQLALFVLALGMIAKLVHVSRVMEGLLSSSVGHVPQFIFSTILSAFMRGEVLTLLAVGAVVFVTLSVPVKVWRMFMPKPQKEAVV